MELIDVKSNGIRIFYNSNNKLKYVIMKIITQRNDMSQIDKILVDVLALNASDKVQVIDKILTSLQPINEGADALWAKEVEERIIAYGEERVPTVEIEDVFQKYSS